MLVFVHPQVGCHAERLHIGGVVGEDGDAHAGADPHCMIVELKRFFEQLDQRMANVFGIRAAGRLLQNHGKLVSPGSSDGIGTADPSGADRAYTLQQQIADVMPQRVIHLLEMIQIDQQQSRLRSGPASALASRS